MILITDHCCTWGPECSDAPLAVATQVSQIWDSAAQMAILGNLLINEVFLSLGQGPKGA